MGKRRKKKRSSVPKATNPPDNPNHKKLAKLFYTAKSPGSFTSPYKLYKAAAQLQNGGPRIDGQMVKSWLDNEEVQSLHKPVRLNFKRSKVLTKGLRDMLEIDLIDVSNISDSNDDIKFILVLIDAFSRELWVAPQKSKNAKDTLKSLSFLLEKSGIPQRIRGDSGKEFVNKHVEDKIERNNIKFINVNNEKSKAAFAERVIRTLKKKIYKYLHRNRTNRYIDVLDDLVHSYNNTYHSSIRMKPNEVNKANEFEVWMKLYMPSLLKAPRPPNFSVNDKVRITRYRNKFPRGYYQQWTQEFFKISKVIRSSPMRYQLVDLKDEPITGSFYEDELQKVYKPDTTKYDIEDIVDERGRGLQKQYLVKFEGWPAKFNEWVKAKDVTNL